MTDAAERTASSGRTPRIRIAVAIARGVIWGSAVFCLVTATLLMATVAQLRRVDPINSQALVLLRERFEADVGDVALAEEIRALDLMTRRALLTSETQMRTGALLLTIGLAVLVLGVQARGSLLHDTVLPSAELTSEDPVAQARRTRRGLAVSLVLLLVSVGAVRSVTYLKFSAFDVEGWVSPGQHAASLAEDGVAPTQTTPAAVPQKLSPDIGAEAPERTWPMFRGPDGLGVIADRRAPLVWNGETGDGMQWKVPIPQPGYGSPVVWGDMIFLVGGDADRRAIYAFGIENGELLWEAEVPSTPGVEAPEVTDDTGYAAPTPVTDGQRVAAIFATGDVAAFDTRGRLLWHRNLGLPDNPYGHASSLLLDAENLIVQFDHNREAFVIALEIDTGRTLWKTPRDMISWSSPVRVVTDFGPQAVLTSSRSVTGYDFASGRVLWSVDCLGGEMGPSPAYAEGIIVVANEYAVAAGLRPVADNAEPELLWEWFDALPSVASPVAAGGLVLMATDYGTVSCLDTTTGEVHWQSDFDAGFYASPIIVGERVYLLDMAGMMHVIRLGNSLDVLVQNPTGERVFSTPAFVDGRVILRGARHLFAFGGDALEADVE